MTQPSQSTWPWWVSLLGPVAFLIGMWVGPAVFDLHNDDKWLFALVVATATIIEGKLWIIRRSQIDGRP